jgi:hypothetical protein
MAGVVGSGCGAPKGNKYAEGHGCGRPKQYSNEFIEEQGRKLLEWAHTEEAIVLRLFAPLNGYPASYLWRWADENEVFCNYFEQAKDIIGVRREMISISNKSDMMLKRYATLHDKRLHDHERDDLRFESSLKVDENKTTTDVQEFNFRSLMEQLSESRKALSDADKSKSKDK